MTNRDELYFISMAARQLDMHPQTLRKYERLGLVRRRGPIGSVRVYSSDESNGSASSSISSTSWA